MADRCEEKAVADIHSQMEQNSAKEKKKSSEPANGSEQHSLFCSDAHEEESRSRKKPRFTVIPVQINNEKDWLHLRSQVGPRSRHNSQREPERSVSWQSISECPRVKDCDPEITLSLTISSNQPGTTESCHTLNGVPPSLVSVVLPKGTRTPPKVSSQKTKSSNPLARLGVVPHGATIPPLHETTDSQHTHVLSKLLLESEKNILYGTSDGRILKVMSSKTSSQLLESGSIHDYGLPFRREMRFCGNDKKGEKIRSCWRTKLEFLLSCIGACVGLGSFWRLPYLCLAYGRVAFLVPYFVILCIGGIPLLLAELFLGQFTQRGPIKAIKNICPIMQGVGVSLLVLSLFSSVYYTFIFSESVLSLGMALGEPLTLCNSSTKVLFCAKDEVFSARQMNLSNTVLTRRRVDDDVPLVDQSDHMVEAVIALIVTLTGSWVVVYFALWKSVRSIGKVTKVSATLPFVLITAFVWRALTLPGATVGLQYLFTPRWNYLMAGEVWVNAAVQVLISLNVVSGSTIVFSSYNKFWNNVTTDVWIISIISCVSSLLAVLVVFSGIGNIAAESGFAIEDIDFAGADLALVVYPQILSKMPRKHLWAALFFLLLLLLGIDSQFASVEVIVTSVNDSMMKMKSTLKLEVLKRFFSKNEFRVMIVCLICFLCSLPFVFQGATLFDHTNHTKNFEAMNVAVLFLALCEIMTLTWLYGTHRMHRNIFQMTSKHPSHFYLYCWKFFTPFGFLVLWVTSLISYHPPGFLDMNGNSQITAVLLGWIIAACSILPVPIFSLISLSAVNSEGSLRQRLMRATSPQHEAYREWFHTSNKEKLFSLNFFKCFSNHFPQSPETPKSPKEGLRRNETSLSV